MTHKQHFLLPAFALAILMQPACNETGSGGKTKSGADSTAVSAANVVSNTIMTERMKAKLAGKYDDVADYSEGFIAVSRDGKYTFVDSNGKELLPPQFETMSSFQNGYASVTRDGKQGLIDPQGRDVFPFHADWAYLGSVEDGLIAARNRKEKYGFVNLRGEVVVPFEYDDLDVSWFRYGAAIVGRNHRFGLINRQNAVLLPLEYDFINTFDEGSNVTTAQNGSGWMLIRRDGSIVSPNALRYSEVGSFSHGLALVKQEEQYGFIDTTGREVIPATFHSAGYFNRWGLAKVHDNKEGWLIDRSGAPVMKKGYWDIDQVAPDQFLVTLPGDNGKQGMINREGKELWPMEFTGVIPMEDDVFLVTHPTKGRYFANAKGDRLAGYTE